MSRTVTSDASAGPEFVTPTVKVTFERFGTVEGFAEFEIDNAAVCGGGGGGGAEAVSKLKSSPMFMPPVEASRRKW